MSTYLNSNSTQFQLNFHSISSQPYFNFRFKSTSTITSTQYGCDIKATQSCNIQSLFNITLQNWTLAMLSLALLSPSLLWLFFHFDLYIFLNFGVVLDIFKLRQGASIPCFVGWSVCLSQKCKCPIFQHIIANRYLFHLWDDEKEEEE